jgi:DNA-binding MarR family transcriptional regulator
MIVSMFPSSTAADTVVDGLFPAIGTVRRLLRRVAAPAFATDDPLPASQHEVLMAVGRHPGSAVAEIAHELGLAPNSVSTIVTQLVAAGLVVRETDAHDRRIGRLALTTGARERVERVRARRRGALHEALDRLGPEQVAALATGVGVLNALAEQLQALEQERERVEQQ